LGVQLFISLGGNKKKIYAWIIVSVFFLWVKSEGEGEGLAHSLTLLCVKEKKKLLHERKKKNIIKKKLNFFQ
jgi:hypothetical protein